MPATIGFGVWHLKQTFRFKKLRSLQDGQFLSDRRFPGMSGLNWKNNLSSQPIPASVL